MTTASPPVTKADLQRSGRGLGWGVFVAGFVPGLLQWRLGQRARALVAFGSCLGLFLLGWTMVRERLFYFAILSPEPPPGGASAWPPWPLLARIGVPLTLPELLNLPGLAIGTWLSFDNTNEGMRLWRLPRPMEDLGGFLTAASGMLAAFWSADAHWSLRWQRDARPDVTKPPARNPAFCAGVSWLVPGLGHVLAGQRGKGLLLLSAVTIVYAAGLLFSHGHAVDRAIASVWWIGQSLCGGGTLFASLVTAPLPMTAFPEHLELGTNLCTVAGLMNLVVMVDAFTVAERQSFPLQRPKEAQP
jgi:hypothetical protein